MPDGRRIEVVLDVHPAFGLLLLPLQVGADQVFMFISGSPMSGIAPGSWGDLLLKEHLIYPDAPGSSHRLDHLRIGGEPVPPIEVRQSRRAGRFRLDGELGLNFFRNFREACFQMPADPNAPIVLSLELL